MREGVELIASYVDQPQGGELGVAATAANRAAYYGATLLRLGPGIVPASEGGTFVPVSQFFGAATEHFRTAEQLLRGAGA